mmetsp:Transcript_23473/g.59337  ORF Transcript_23473/g.59337 Transcript_23473/m.59337 type:complete len:207 (-) Transcript_23473:134-754(-)
MLRVLCSQPTRAPGMPEKTMPAQYAPRMEVDRRTSAKMIMPTATASMTITNPPPIPERVVFPDICERRRPASAEVTAKRRRTAMTIRPMDTIAGCKRSHTPHVRYPIFSFLAIPLTTAVVMRATKVETHVDTEITCPTCSLSTPHSCHPVRSHLTLALPGTAAARATEAHDASIHPIPTALSATMPRPTESAGANVPTRNDGRVTN